MSGLDRAIYKHDMNTMFDMGGYEFYVWGSVLCGVAVFAWNLLAPAVQRRTVMQRLADPEDMEEGS